MIPKGKVTLDLKQIDEIRQKIAEGKGLRAHVGVMGDKNIRQKVEERKANQHWSSKSVSISPASDKPVLTNAEIGLRHEFGSMAEKLPMRSFLRMPLFTKLHERMKQIGEGFWLALITKQGMWQALRTLGIQGEYVVQQAFKTEGWGQWPALSQYTVQLKGSSSILIDSAQLRNSITSAVVKEGKVA